MNFFSVLNNLVQVLVPIAIGCVLPALIVWFYSRRKMNDENNRTQIIMALIEKNPNLDIEETLKKFAPTQKKPKLLKEKMLSKLHWGIITLILGIGLVIFDIYLSFIGGAPGALIGVLGCPAAILIAIGIALLLNYNVGKKMLADEMEAEQKQLTTKA